MDYIESREFSDIRLSGGTVENRSFTDCVFTDCRIENVTFRNCAFRDCVFNSCSVRNIRSDVSLLKGAEFTGCRLFGMNFSELGGGGPFDEPLYRMQDSELRYCYFINMELKKFRFASNSFSDCEFSSCQMPGSDFSGCDLTATSFSGCDLRNCDFRRAAGYRIDIASNRLKDALFSLPEAVSLLAGLGIKVE